MINIRITDLYYEAEKEIRARENELSIFVKYEIPKDPKLEKLWMLAFSHDPSDKNYPVAKKVNELKAIQPEHIEYIIEKSNSDSENFIFYRLLLSSLIPLCWSIGVVHTNPDLSLSEILNDASQEIMVEYFDNGETIKTQTISTEWPNFATIHTIETDREELCIEFCDEVRIKDLQFLENYVFHLFKKKRGNPELQHLLWGGEKTKYFITIINKLKKKTFPAPIYSRHLKLINALLNNPQIKEKINHTEMDDDPKVQRASMQRRLFEYALKFRGEGSSKSYFKNVLPYDDEFKKATTQITYIDENSKEKTKTRILKSKHERSGGSINDLGENKLPLVEWMITLTQIIDLLDDPKEKQGLNLLLEEYTQEEIAKELNIHQSTVSRLKKKIKKIIK